MGSLVMKFITKFMFKILEDRLMHYSKHIFLLYVISVFYTMGNREFQLYLYDFSNEHKNIFI